MLMRRKKERGISHLADADSRDGRLESLSISGFRGISQLTISRLGRVALVAGKNGVGKTTVLDALRVYAARGRFDALEAMLTNREELIDFSDEDGDRFAAPAVDRLFHRNGTRPTIVIGPMDGQTLVIEEPSEVPRKVINDYRGWVDNKDAEDIRVLRVVFNNVRIFYPWSKTTVEQSRFLRRMRLRDHMRLAAPIRCESLGPGLMGSTELARLWDNVVLRKDETLALEALRLVFDGAEGIAVIGENTRGSPRRIVVKLANHAYPVPLRSLGDGAIRMFGVALALTNCRDGILLIDEAENGIHYSLQSKFWNMILRAAAMHNVQVLATTHSKNCIDGFAVAAVRCPDISANLIRLEHRNGEMRAVEYSKDELKVTAEQNIEVR